MKDGTVSSISVDMKSQGTQTKGTGVHGALVCAKKKCFKFSVENFEVSSSRRTFAVEAPPQDRAVLQSRLEPTAERGSEEDRGGGVSTHSLRAVWTPWDWKDHNSYRSNTTGAVPYLKLGPFQRTASPRLRCWPANATLSPLVFVNWTARFTTFCPIAAFWCAHLPTALQTSSAAASITADSCTLRVWLESMHPVGRRR